jgi:hypothetical protein
MGWSYGTNDDGREVGYSVEAVCDLDGCNTAINRGLAYCCGGMHDGDEHGCGGYFCGEHMTMGIPLPEQMCAECAEQFESDPNRVAARVAEINQENTANGYPGEYVYDCATGDIAYMT